MFVGVQKLRLILGGVLIALAVAALDGCSPAWLDQRNDEAPNASDAVKSADLQPRALQQTLEPGAGAASAGGKSFFGKTPLDAGSIGPAPQKDATGDDKDGFTLNFENSPVTTVAKVVLGDILGVGYVIDPRAQGTISLSSGRPLAKKDLLFVLESALRANNLALVRDAAGYRIAPSGETVVGQVDRDGAGGPEPGYGTTIVPLQYVSGATMAKLLEGFAGKPGSVRTNPAGTLLIVQGNSNERQAAIDTVRNFDVDWMSGQSVGIYPIHNSTPEPIVAELEKIFDSGETGMNRNLIKLQPIERQNALLVVATRPDLLKTAAIWVSRLDSSSVSAAAVKVYKVRFGDAKQLAQLLNDMFVGGSSLSDSATNAIAPSSGAKTLSALDRLSANGSAGGASQSSAASGASSGAPPSVAAGASNIPAAGAANSATASLTGSGGNGSAGVLPGVRITPDVANNALLIYADAENYRAIESALNQLDRPKLQVAIDVTIAEVTLNDSLNYGVQFYLANKYGSIINSAGGEPVSPTLPGFNVLVGSQMTPHAIISALHSLTDVKILSNPSLVVVDNQEATLEVGDQVPVSTGSATVLSANNTIVNTIDYRNTGIILHVQPRVNSNGNVLLDIEQEISSTPPGTTANLTPTISQRRVKSSISVASGQTVLLAGLVSDTQNNSRLGVPILDQIPYVGAAFSTTSKSTARTELVLFIRPQIIRDAVDASMVAEELRSKMRGDKIGAVTLPNALNVGVRPVQ
ncbi:type II secretion system secretin GspD [Methylocapsa sp. S129]|uniref:type II secretion system secretin GspD n=1 Tax=Methylocapsa sp. S129 TaxID=1641869 RepID=UPI001FEED13E|nr:type II secretion system secretin GspD [Methylocapsa sp. S129]